MLISNSQYKAHFDALIKAELSIPNHLSLELRCPICLDCFGDKDSMKMATKEDAPPYALGGSKVVFTCKKCNSNCGDNIDNHFVNYIKRFDQVNFRKGSDRQIKIHTNLTTIRGKLKVLNRHDSILEISSKNNDVRYIEGIISSWEENIRLEFENEKIKLSNNRVNVGILKTAYILLISKLGYSPLLWKEYDILREQILNPDKLIVPRLWSKQNLDIKDGLYITNDCWLRGFFVIFSVKNPDTNIIHRFIVLLPSPKTDFWVARYFLNRIEQGDRIIIKSLNEIDFLCNPSNIIQLNNWAYGKTLRISS